MIVVTGATGQLGAGIVASLLARRPADRIVASVRDPAKAAALAGRGVAVRAGDFASPADLATAFEGASQAMVVSVDRLGDEARRLHRAAIAAARAAGVRRVLYSSHVGARTDSPFAPAADHADAERCLEAGGSFTALRHGFYIESALHLVGGDLRDGEIRAPEDGPVAWTARADLAEADAILLAGPEALDGISPPLTGGEALTLEQVAAVASAATGRTIRRVTLSDQAWLEAKRARGVPEATASMLLGFYRAARRGDFAMVDPTLQRLLGRRPLAIGASLASFLRPAPAA